MWLKIFIFIVLRSKSQTKQDAKTSRSLQSIVSHDIVHKIVCDAGLDWHPRTGPYKFQAANSVPPQAEERTRGVEVGVHWPVEGEVSAGAVRQVWLSQLHLTQGYFISCLLLFEGYSSFHVPVSTELGPLKLQLQKFELQINKVALGSNL